MRVYVVARDIQRHDAVGNFCNQIKAFLAGQGFDVALVAENCHPDDRPSIGNTSDVLPQITVDDVAFFHFSTEDPAFPAIAALDNAKILYFHNITPERFFSGIDALTANLVKLGLEQRPLTSKFDVLMANSRATAHVLHDGLATADRLRIRDSEIISCPPVIGIDRWARITEEVSCVHVDSRTVLYVGRLAPHKGVRQLIEGFTLLAANDDAAHLVCVGGSPASADTHALAETIAAIEPAIAQRIQLVHGISDGALKSIYRNVGICASMSQHEGFGVPLVDALVFDKPLVINSEAGMMETVGDAAIVVNASSPEAVAKALSSALNDTAVRERLASARKARVGVLRQLADGHLILDAVNRARTLHRARIV